MGLRAGIACRVAHPRHALGRKNAVTAADGVLHRATVASIEVALALSRQPRTVNDGLTPLFPQQRPQASGTRYLHDRVASRMGRRDIGDRLPALTNAHGVGTLDGCSRAWACLDACSRARAREPTYFRPYGHLTPVGRAESVAAQLGPVARSSRAQSRVGRRWTPSSQPASLGSRPGSPPHRGVAPSGLRSFRHHPHQTSTRCSEFSPPEGREGRACSKSALA